MSSPLLGVLVAGGSDAWFDDYIAAVLRRPGPASAQRYDIEMPVAGSDGVSYDTLLLFDCDGDPAAVAAGLAGLESAPAVVPFSAVPLGDRVVEAGFADPGGASGPGNRQIIFSDAAPEVSDADFDRWYRAHLDEILTIPGFRAAQRYDLNPDIEQLGTLPTRRMTVYVVDRPPDGLRAEMDRMHLLSAESYVKFKETDTVGVPLPAWWDSVRFGAIDALAVGERVPAITRD